MPVFVVRPGPDRPSFSAVTVATPAANSMSHCAGGRPLPRLHHPCRPLPPPRPANPLLRMCRNTLQGPSTPFFHLCYPRPRHGREADRSFLRHGGGGEGAAPRPLSPQPLVTLHGGCKLYAVMQGRGATPASRPHRTAARAAVRPTRTPTSRTTRTRRTIQRRIVARGLCVPGAERAARR